MQTRIATDIHTRPRMCTLAIASCLVLFALLGCSEDATSPIESSAAPAQISADMSVRGDGAAHVPGVTRVAGSLIRAPHSWPIVNWSTIRGLDAALDENGEPGGTFDLEIQLDLGSGPFLQRTTEEVICLEITERDDLTTDIWISHAGEGWVTVPPGVTHFALTQIVDSPEGDLLAGRSILPEIHGDPAEVCENRPDLLLSDPRGLGSVVPMAAEAGNVVVLR